MSQYIRVGKSWKGLAKLRTGAKGPDKVRATAMKLDGTLIAQTTINGSARNPEHIYRVLLRLQRKIGKTIFLVYVQPIEGYERPTEEK